MNRDGNKAQQSLQHVTTGKRKAALIEGPANHNLEVMCNPFDQILQSSAVKAMRKESDTGTIKSIRSPKEYNVMDILVASSYSATSDEIIEECSKENHVNIKAVAVAVSPVKSQHVQSNVLDHNRRYSLGVSRYSSCSPVRCSRSSLHRRTSHVGPSGLSNKMIDEDFSGVKVANRKVTRKQFIEYVSVGVDQSILCGSEKPQQRARMAPKVHDVFPVREKPLLSSISEFCFPDGASLRLMDIDVAAAMCTEHFDQAHVLQFSDSSGRAKFAYCLVIKEYFESPSEQLLVDLQQTEQYIRAARIIRNFFRSRFVYIKAYNQLRKVHRLEYSKTPSKQKKNLFPSSSIKTPAKNCSVEESEITSAAKSDNFMSRMKQTFSWRKQKPTDRLSIRPSAGLSSMRRISGGLVLGTLGFSDEESEDEGSASDCESDLGSTSNETIATETSNRESLPVSQGKKVVVTERAFCIISDAPNNSLFSQLLRVISNKERCCGSLFSGGSSIDAVMQSKRDRRHRFLHCFQNLNREEMVKSAVDTQYVKTLNIGEISCELQDFTQLVIFSSFPPDLLAKVIQLLLVETSIIVYGKNAGEVTSVASGLASLIAPFKWEGVFIPLLPPSAREVLQAPVPYIVGTTTPPCFQSEGISPCVWMLTLGAGFGTKSMSAKDIHLKGSLWDDYTDESIVSAVTYFQRSMFAFRPNIFQLQKFIGLGCKDVRNAEPMFRCVLSEVRRLAEFIRNVNLRICGDIATEPSGWRKYSKLNKSSNQYEFIPQSFIEPLRKHLVLQERVVHTQLFVSYLDEMRRQEDKVISSSLFIRDWLFFRLYYRNSPRSHRS